MSRFNPFPRVNCQYGAPMGRCDTRRDFDAVERFGVSVAIWGCYDPGGAYWGSAGRDIPPLRAVWEYGKGSEGVTFVRAFTREKAIAIAKGDGD